VRVQAGPAQVQVPVPSLPALPDPLATVPGTADGTGGGASGAVSTVTGVAGDVTKALPAPVSLPGL
jgi:hypothetical protein